MAYISEGQMLESRSPWRLAFIGEMFWGIINFVILFFRTMVTPDLTSKGRGCTSSYQAGGGGGRGLGPPPGPRRRMGGYGGRGGAPSAPPPAGGGCGR
uniref:Selenoprotein K n=1 Tax=Patiria miniata TaxID=46514 RepID=A0A913ZQ14_PATMI